MMVVRLRRSAAILLLLPLTVFLLYRKSLRLWWTYDDPWFLHVAAERRWTEGFTYSDIWRQGLFTPLLTATYDALFTLFGIEAERWYAAQLVLLALLALAVYALLRLWVDDIPAAAGALLFLAAPPLASVSAALGVIHYLEAILLCVLATIAFARGWSVASALLYLVAMLAKEIAVPLPAVLCVIPSVSEGPGRVGGMTRRVIPHAIALAAYTAWRLAVVPLRGGYGWWVGAEEWPRLIVTLPWKLVTASTGTALAAGLTMLALTAAGVSRAVRTRRAILIGLAGLAVLIAPIVPVSKDMQDRYVLLPWLWICAGFALGIATLRPRLRDALILATLAAAVIANRQEWATEFSRNRRMSDEARVYVAVGGNALFRNPLIPPGTMPELRWLKETHLKREKGALWFYDDFFLCAKPYGGKQVFEYDTPRREVRDITARVPAIASRYCSSLRADVPLRAEFSHRGETLFWRLGPYDKGTYGIVLYDGEHAFVVPRQSAFRLGQFTEIALRIRYQSPEGWVTYSPEIHLDFARQPDRTWHR